MQKQKAYSPTIYLLLRFFAFVMPFYFVYYCELQENPNLKHIKTWWKYTLSGIGTYILLIILLVLFQNNL